jgi:cytoskeletal protein CcmA (bactofilin family)
MRTITERARGEIIVREDTHIQGIVNGDVHVERGGSLLHQGVINGTVTVEGGEANIFGFVKGDVVNNGGNLNVFGTVNGTVRTDSGNTKIAKDAFIKEIIDLREPMKAHA